MNKSEQINELAGALAVAQGAADRFAEAAAIVPLARLIAPQRGKNQLSAGPVVQRFFEKIAFGVSDCWYWRGAKHKLGYGLFNSVPGESKAHRASWRLHNGDIPAGMMVLHKCDVRCCVNPDHLYLGTQFDNMRDCVERGRHVNTPRFGEANPMSVLTAAMVRQMRVDHAAGASMRSLAKKYNVSEMTAYRAIKRESWKEID